MRIDRKELCKIIIVLIGFLQFIKPFVFFDLSKGTFLLGLFLFFMSIPIMGKSFKRTALTFLILSIVLLLFDHRPIHTLIVGTNSMLNIIAILIIMQLFIVPIETGKYSQAIEYFLFKKIKSTSGLFLVTSFATHIFSSFLLFGTIPVMLSLMEDAIKKRVNNYKQFVSTTISRGYSLVVLWAPGAINILLVLQATGTKWVEIFFPGLILSFLGLGTSFVLERKFILMDQKDHSDQQNDYQGDMEPKEAWKKILHIFLVVGTLVLITLLLENINFATSSNRIMVAGILVASVWSLKYIRNKEIKGNFHKYWRNEVVKNMDLATLFVAMGIFTEALNGAGVISLFEKFVLVHSNDIGMYILFLLPLAIILFSITGIHPFISIVMVGKILGALTLPVSQVSIALALGVGGAISYIVSPFAGIVLTLSKFIDCSPAKISLKWNGIFSIIYYIEGVIFIYIYTLFVA